MDSGMDRHGQHGHLWHEILFLEGRPGFCGVGVSISAMFCQKTVDDKICKMCKFTQNTQISEKKHK